MNKFVLLILLTTFLQCLGVILVMLKARLADVSEITIQNMLNIHWLWQQKFIFLAVILLAVPWLGTSFLIAQVSKEMSSGTLTATITTLIPGVIGPIVFIGQFLVFQVLRNEAIPSFGPNRIWMSILALAMIQGASIFLSLDLIRSLGSWEFCL